ncbi:protein YgfX [Teredinibacter haidensis]|uniref:protein YgfX n=1 Tax=Teredinibacter haidensis TaxID=2731755 RepID=UPI0009489DCF|nr:protein YgfX [Teredinibacter haidensis]
MPKRLSATFFSLRPVVWLKYLSLLLHSLCVILIAFLDAMPWAKGGALLLLVLSLIRQGCFWRQLNSVTGIQLEDNRIFLCDTEGKLHPIVLRDLVLTRLIVIIRYKPQEGSIFLGRSLVIVAGSLSCADDFRKLRVLFKNLSNDTFSRGEQ